MSCDGHKAHAFEQPMDPECEYCGHPESEHPGGAWPDDPEHLATLRRQWAADAGPLEDALL